jgi:hypothetical protein
MVENAEDIKKIIQKEYSYLKHHFGIGVPFVLVPLYFEKIRDERVRSEKT